MAKKLKLVVILWEDPCTEDAWLPRDLARDLRPLVMSSVGWIIYEDSDRVVISSMVSRSTNTSQVTSIPTTIIRDIVEVDFLDITREEEAWIYPK